MIHNDPILKLLCTGIVLTLVASLSGCASIVLGGAAVGGTVAMQERTTGNAMDDMGVELTLEKKLIEAEDGRLFKHIDVDVLERRVLLTGSVTTPEDAAQAVNLAWSIAGTQEVVNEIQVAPVRNLSQRSQDSWIETQITAQLLGKEGVHSVNYNIEAVNNVVYLIGIAESQAELNMVLDIARRTRYVQKVISHIRLKDDPLRKPYRF